MVKQYGVSEQGFIDKLKEDVVRATFIDSISANKSVIPGLTEIILEDVLQTRELELVKIPFSAFKIPNIIKTSSVIIYIIYIYILHQSVHRLLHSK